MNASVYRKIFMQYRPTHHPFITPTHSFPSKQRKRARARGVLRPPRARPDALPPANAPTDTGGNWMHVRVRAYI